MNGASSIESDIQKMARMYAHGQVERCCGVVKGNPSVPLWEFDRKNLSSAQNSSSVFGALQYSMTNRDITAFRLLQTPKAGISLRLKILEISPRVGRRLDSKKNGQEEQQHMYKLPLKL